MASAAINYDVFSEGQLDRSPWSYYDRVSIASGAMAASYNFFTHSISANGKSVTNLVTANRFNPPNRYILQSIGWFWLPNSNFTDIVNVVDNYYFELKIDQKVFVEGTLPFYPAGAGVWASTVQTNIGVYSNGVPVEGAMRRFPEWARGIPPNVNFSLQLISSTTSLPTLSATFVLWVYLDGLADRSVQ